MSTHLNVVSTFRFSPASEQILGEAAGAPIHFATPDELATALTEAEVLCSYDIPGNAREVAPRLRWLQVPGAGVDSLKSKGLLDAGSEIIITTASGIHATTICEYVFGSMLMFNWNWPQMVRLQSQHVWARSASSNVPSDGRSDSELTVRWPSTTPSTKSAAHGSSGDLSQLILD